MVICSHDAEVTEIVKLLQTKNIDYELFGVVKSRTGKLTTFLIAVGNFMLFLIQRIC